MIEDFFENAKTSSRKPQLIVQSRKVRKENQGLGTGQVSHYFGEPGFRGAGRIPDMSGDS